MPAFRGHDPSRKFHCDVPGCSASFVKRAHLRRHEMTHTQRRDFTCPGCSRAFSRNDSMARHLRRKHPHLYRSQEATPNATTGIERLYTGSLSSVAGPSASADDFASASGYSLTAFRPPFDHNATENMQRRYDDTRTATDALGRPSTSLDMYSREMTLQSPKETCVPQWRAGTSSHTTDPPHDSFIASAVSTTIVALLLPGKTQRERHLTGLFLFWPSRMTGTGICRVDTTMLSKKTLVPPSTAALLPSSLTSLSPWSVPVRSEDHPVPAICSCTGPMGHPFILLLIMVRFQPTGPRALLPSFMGSRGNGKTSKCLSVSPADL